MQRSPKMLLALGSFCLVLILGLFWVRLHDPAQRSTRNLHTMGQGNYNSNVFDVATGDTNNEVLRTVIANQKKLQAKNEALVKENSSLKAKQSKNLKSALAHTAQSLTDQIAETKKVLEQEIHNQRSHLSFSDKENTTHSSGSVSFTVNDESDSMELTQPASNNSVDMIHEVSDLSQNTDENLSERTLSPPLSDKESMPQFTNHASEKDSPISISPSPASSSVLPYYTIPANSTMNQVSLMSSLIAEVPVSGHLLSPAFPFKAIVGRRGLLAANGMTLPSELAGMILEGYSVGNMTGYPVGGKTMSCARAYVTRALFVFNDGHFVVYPEKATENATELYPSGALGYLSDPYGNPCIVGRYITDAPKVIRNMVMLSSLSSGASALSQSQMTTLNSGFQTTTQLTGDMAKYLSGAMINGASEKALEWYTSRVSDIFDAVYIPASQNHQPTRVVFNVTRTIPIDLNQKGRLLRYEHTSNLSSHSHRLD